MNNIPKEIDMTRFIVPDISPEEIEHLKIRTERLMGGQTLPVDDSILQEAIEAELKSSQELYESLKPKKKFFGLWRRG